MSPAPNPRPVIRELGCPCARSNNVELRGGFVRCNVCGAAWGLRDIVPTGRWRPSQFRPGRYPEAEPWRGRR